MDHTEQTLRFYDRNAGAFVSGTAAADMGESRARFAACLPAGGTVLDLGCGSGRDTKAFLEMGFRAEATDGSAELCALASAYTGIRVRREAFGELDDRGRYDGIWACASILHLPRKELADVLGRIRTALKPGGTLYASFKYGNFEGMSGGRYFTCFTKETLAAFWKDVKGLQVFDLWITEDIRPDRRGEKWLNLLARKAEGP